MENVERLDLEDNLQEIYDEERSRLGLDNIEIELRKSEYLDTNNLRERFSSLREALSYGLKNCATEVGKLGDERYVFRINPTHLSRSARDTNEFRRMCRHELYHIAAGHTESPSLWRYILFDEPLAMFYEYTGLNVSRIDRAVRDLVSKLTGNRSARPQDKFYRDAAKSISGSFRRVKKE